MKKYAAIIAGLTAIILLTQTNLFNDLLFFFLVGAIPGTTKSVPSSVMLSAIIAVSWIIIFSSRAARQFTSHALAYARATYLELKTQYTKRHLGDA